MRICKIYHYFENVYISFINQDFEKETYAQIQIMLLLLPC